MTNKIRTFLIVVNPVSGRGRGLRTAKAVAQELRDRGHNVTVRRTTRSGDAEAMVMEQGQTEDAQPDCIVACGGDGTIQEIANGLVSLKNTNANDANRDTVVPVMGLAPSGRCNDFGRALGISRKAEFIADVLAEGTPMPIDLGRVNDRCFCTVATIGIDAAVSSYVDTMRVPITGTMAYLYGALRVLFRYVPQQLKISGDFGTIERPVFLASSANTSTYGGAIPIVPGAAPTDGLLDLCVINHMRTLRTLAMVGRVLRGRHVEAPEVQIIRTERLTIETDPPLELWADGERIGHTPAAITALPGAVRIMLPKSRG